MGGGSVRKRLSRRIPGSFLLRRSFSSSQSPSPPRTPSRSPNSSSPNYNPRTATNQPLEVEATPDNRRPYGREDSETSRLSSASNNSISTVSLSSGSSQQQGNPNMTVSRAGSGSGKGIRAKGPARGFTGSNWLFSESFCQPIHSAPVKGTDATVDKCGIPRSTHDQLVLRLWTITVKGFLCEKMTVFEKEWLRNLPEGAQNSVTNLYQQITIFDYENADFDVETNTTHLPLVAENGTGSSATLPTLAETSSSRRETPALLPQSKSSSSDDIKIKQESNGNESAGVNGTESKSEDDQTKRKPSLFRSPSLSPRGGVHRQSSGMDRRALFIEKRSLSGRLSFPSSKISRKSQNRTNVLDAANAELEAFGLKAVLCKHESHHIGGSIVLSYYIRLEKSRGFVRTEPGAFQLSAIKNTVESVETR